MKKTKHTPGPWKVGQRSSEYETEIHDGQQFGRIGTVISNNAHLIAAAPEMFKTLDDVLSVLLDLDQDHLSRREEKEVCDAIQEIEAVLAKAKGGGLRCQT
ncbi:hypothetical protein [Bdellovibrio sp. ArHS]|uniref:hypothetical protein n=1 Tax=Bdellovibrio sp. ArHS TaxID=1569284 RepID=UPI0025C43219|nr:hypothetical protein [Bdellovibrio sp. ArHS]